MNLRPATFVFVCVMIVFTGCASHTPSTTAQPAPAGLHASATGATLFHEKGCEHCHGANFAGTEKAPALLTIGKRLNKTAIERQIRNGGKQMPAFGGVLQPEEISALADMLSKKKKAPKGVHAATP